MSDDHSHHDGNGHDHPPAPPQALRAEALEAILIERGLLKPDAVDKVIATYNDRVGPMNGARMVAKAWLDPDFHELMLRDGTAAVASFGFVGGQVEKLVVVPNGPGIHNLVVCTLCSCYPWAVLGLPPRWYKDPAYRSRVVREPRAVLEDFQVQLPATTQINVWDSSAEVRYLVLPERPHGTELLDEQALAKLVTRDSMIGVGFPLAAGAEA